MPVINKALFSKKVAVSLMMIMCFASSLFAQESMAVQQNKLKTLFDRLISCTNDDQRLSVNRVICDGMIDVLNSKESCLYPFDSLNYMGKLMSPDKKLRLYSWNLVMDDGSYRYFCFIQQIRKSGEIYVEQLSDMISPASKDDNTIHSGGNWIGALYYQIVPFKRDNKQFYLLLGWDGHNVRTNRKIIEVLHFDKVGRAIFGAPLINWNGNNLNRVIFEYAKQAQMILKYEPSHKRVVFDHLSPMSTNYKDQFEYYGPDFSHDALLLKEGVWILKEDVKMRNFRK